MTLPNSFNNQIFNLPSDLPALSKVIILYWSDSQVLFILNINIDGQNVLIVRRKIIFDIFDTPEGYVSEAETLRAHKIFNYHFRKKMKNVFFIIKFRQILA